MSSDPTPEPQNPPQTEDAENDSPASSDPAPEEVLVLQGEASTATDEELLKWFAAQQIKSVDHVEAGARQIIALCSTLLTILFGLVALTGSAPPIYTQRALFQWLSLVGVVGLFLALFCALMVVIPSTYRVAINDPDALEARFGEILQHKTGGLNLAVVSFTIAMFCLTAMIVGALLVWYGWI